MAADIHIVVRVQNGRVQAPAIRLYPYVGTSDDVFIQSATPELDMQVSVGQELELDLDIYYALDSADQGRVVVALGLDGIAVATAYKEVEKGSGSVGVQLPVVAA